MKVSTRIEAEQTIQRERLRVIEQVAHTRGERINAIEPSGKPRTLSMPAASDRVDTIQTHPVRRR